MIILLIVVVVVVFTSHSWLLAIKLEKELAERTSEYLKNSIFYLILQGFNLIV